MLAYPTLHHNVCEISSQTIVPALSVAVEIVAMRVVVAGPPDVVLETHSIATNGQTVMVQMAVEIASCLPNKKVSLQ